MRATPVRSASDLRVHSFLKLGYFIDYADDLLPIDFSRLDRAAYAHHSEEELIRIGIEKLRATFESQFQSGRDHVVPISGGLDSRLVLAQLLEHTEARNLHTVTWGLPGTYDYEIGCLVAKEAGTRHTPLPMNNFTYSQEDLEEAARRTHCQINMFWCAPIRALLRCYEGALIWSGYIGDFVAGSALIPVPGDLQQARARYLNFRTMTRSMKLHDCSDEELLPHVACLDTPPGVMTFEERVFYAEAAAKFTAPMLLLKGLSFKTPFVNSPWMDFMMSVPDRFRLNEPLLASIAKRAHSQLFGLPTKKAFGLPLGSRKELVFAARALNRVQRQFRRLIPGLRHQSLQYNDLDEGFRRSPDLRRICRENLADLKRRGLVPWLDLDAILRRHEQRLGNHGDALGALVALEIVTKVAERQPSVARSSEPRNATVGSSLHDVS